MHPQSTEQQTGTIRVAFDVMAGVEPLTFPAVATDEAITTRLHHRFLLAEVIDDGNEFTVEIDREAGTVKVLVDGDVIEHGSITHVPDYWLTLADEVRQAADRLATLAGTTPPVKVQLAITGAYPGNTDRTASAVTDAVAAALGVSAYSHAFPAGDSVYKADRDFGKLHAQVATYLPAEQSELERLRARNAELEAQLAEGGATR